MLLRDIDHQIGLTHCLAHAFDNQRRLSCTDHPLRDLLAQRIYLIACGYEDDNDANALRKDAIFKLGVDRKPLDSDSDLASIPTFSCLDNAATTRDVYRMAKAFSK